MTDGNRAENVLEHVAVSRRESMRKLLITGAYAAPAVASFTLAGMSVAEAGNYGDADVGVDD